MSIAQHVTEGWAVYRGYSWPGLEKISQIIDTGDDNEEEVYDIGNETNTRQPNQWLPESTILGFRYFMVNFYSDCDRVGKDILRALAIGLDLEDE
ncbi:hypothetical protein BDV18DRAFT_155810 [Aspergillus unguis]